MRTKERNTNGRGEGSGAGADKDLTLRRPLRLLAGSLLRRANAAQDDPSAWLRRFAFQRGWLDVLERAGISHTYDYSRDFYENLREPPQARALQLEQSSPNWTLLGHKVRYPLGVAASPLTADSRWIKYFADQGFNIITYKTVRSSKTKAHPHPNWIFLENLQEPLSLQTGAEIVAQGSRRSYPDDLSRYSMANSFGIPSQEPEQWQRDIAETLAGLDEGQLLIVSVVGSAEGHDLVSDFVEVARLAERAGAEAIELNLSCPNTLSDSGTEMRPPLSESADDAALVVRAVRRALRPESKLIAKLGYMAAPRLEAVVTRIAEDVDGISGINTLPRRVRTAEGVPAFRGTVADAHNREVAGVSGIALRDFAIDFVRNLAALRAEKGWEFDIIGMGGVMDGHDVRAMMAAGADAVQSATAAANNPDLPAEVLSQEPGVNRDLLGALSKAVADSQWEFRTTEGLARDLGMDPPMVEKLLSSHPEIARKSPLVDEKGRDTWTASQRPVSWRERAADLRRVLARQ